MKFSTNVFASNFSGVGAEHAGGASSAGFRWWGAWGPGVVRGPMCGYRIFR